MLPKTELQNEIYLLNQVIFRGSNFNVKLEIIKIWTLNWKLLNFEVGIWKMRGEGLTIKDFKFFKEYHDELRAKLDENDKNNFMSCPNDETKFIYIREKSSLTDLNFKFNFESSKDNGVAQSFKDKGNKCFQKEEYKEALDMYNQALIHIEFIEGKFVCFNFKIPHKTS